MFDKKIVIPVSLVDFIEDTVTLTSEELGQVFRLAMKKVQYERAEECCEGDNGEIEHENPRVKYAAIALFNGIILANQESIFLR
tara:strand:- start:2654 stop:2905 length:252 start_codon:yes stop_codon:yes gene_type:complete